MFFFQNVSGLKTKAIQFIIICLFDIVIVTETYLCYGILDSDLCVMIYLLFFCRNSLLGEGVIIMCIPYLQACARHKWKTNELECVWITLPLFAQEIADNLYIAVVYIPHNFLLPSKIQFFIEIMLEIRNNNLNNYFVVVDDFNLL